MRKSLELFNRIDPRILSFLIPCLFFLGLRLNFNEEQYFGYAKAFMNSSWMKDSFLFTDFPGTRILFQWIYGFLLRYISFEQMAFWGRLTAFILLAFPVAALAKHFKLNNILLSFWLIVLFLPQQNFFGGEWIYGGFESKSISYVFVLWSLVFILRDKVFPGILFAAASVYWHMLVGGWYSIYVFVFLAPRLLNDRRILYYWLAFGIIQLPFLVYIYKGLLQGGHPVINGVNISYVYSYIRNPNHTGIFKSPEYFFDYHAVKIAVAMLALVLSVFIYRRILPGYLRPVNNFLVIVLCQNLLFVAVAYFDHNGVLMKTYPFRGSSLAMLLFQLETIVVFRKTLIPALLRLKLWKPGFILPLKTYKFQMFSLLILIFIIALSKGNYRLEKYQRSRANWEYTNNLAEAVRQNSKPSETYLLLCRESEFMLSLPRKAERDCYFYDHFIPTRDEGIYEWYQRRLLVDKIKNQPELIRSQGDKINASLLVSCSKLNYDFLDLIQVYGPFHLYRIHREL